jgi:hypothetical protein
MVRGRGEETGRDQGRGETVFVRIAERECHINREHLVMK